METSPRNRHHTGGESVEPSTPDELLEKLRLATPGSSEWILYAAAAFDAVVEHPMILVGGGAQVVYTQQPRPTDVDMVGLITARDLQVLDDAGFVRHGRHWLHSWTLDEVFVEVPDAVLLGVDTPRLVDVDGHQLRVISVDDLMMDRLVQATDRTDITWDEAVALAGAAFHRVNWDRIRERCMIKRTEDIGLLHLPQVLDEVLAEVQGSGATA